VQGRKASKPAADPANGPRAICSNGREATLPDPEAQAIRADLTGSDTCSALGITACAYSPVFALCRRLVVAGHDSRRPLCAYRGDTLTLIVRTIGEGATLAVEDDRLGRPRLRLRRAKSDGAAPPIAQNAEGLS
jgi:hypothetical protein